MEQLISQSHALCIQTFQQLCKAAADSEQCPESLQLAFLDELDKYRIWSGNLGASHAGRTYKLSLDYRLREATFYKDQVIGIVDTLQRHVEDARQIVCGERKPFEDFSESDSDEESPDLSPSNDTPYGKGHDSPWESSSESGSIPESESSKVRPKASDETSELLPSATELAQLLEAIKLTIRSLYKLPIRKPAPVDRLKGNLTDSFSCFQPFDCMYVRDKFPRLSREVADRIGSHITRRRQLLLYRQGHQEFLHATNLQNETTASHPESKPQTLRSKATTFKHDGEKSPRLDFLPAPSVAESISKTSIVASQVTQETPVEVPPRPKDLKGTSKIMFECKLCALTTHIESDRAWKKHVLSDLQPYVCTFPGCNLGGHMFENRDAWFQHEMQMHRVEYFCNAEAHPTYRNLSEFKDHMQREHDISLAELSNPAAMNMFRRPASSSGGICNLCFRDQPVKNMKSHVSKHLEQVCLFAIPRAEYGEDDVDAGENQSRQAQRNLEQSISQDGGPKNRNPCGSPTPLQEDLSEKSTISDVSDVDWESLMARSTMTFDREALSRNTALLAAIRAHNIAIVETLIREGAEVNFPATEPFKWTPLQVAVDSRSFEMVSFLLGHGADVNAPPAERGGRTALQLAAAYGRFDMAHLLLSHGADVNAPGAQVDGRTALEEASQYGHIDMIQLFLDAGGGIIQEQLWRAMELAKENGYMATFRLLDRFRLMSVLE